MRPLEWEWSVVEERERERKEGKGKKRKGGREKRSEEKKRYKNRERCCAYVGGHSSRRGAKRVGREREVVLPDCKKPRLAKARTSRSRAGLFLALPTIVQSTSSLSSVY